MKYVIVGNGVAAIGAIEGIRSRDKEGEILVISDEKVPTYGRPLISYYLADKIKLETLPFRPEEFYVKNKVEMKLDSRVMAVDPVKKEATLADGESVAYDKLLLATGGSPVTPDLPGVEGEGVFNFTTVAHAESLKSLEGKVKKVAVIGAGLIALKSAEGFSGKDVEITLIVRSRIMRSYFDESAGDMVVSHLEKNGLNFLQGAKTKGIVRDKDGKVTGVDTDKGLVEADAVIVAAGVRPHAALAKSCGIRVNQGIMTDDFMRTSDKDVFAAGDVAEAKDLLTGEYTVRPIWPNAYNQGLYAGYNMAGAEMSYAGGLAMNSITYYGLPTVTVGESILQDESGLDIYTHLDKDNQVYRKLVFRGDVLAGCILIGDIDGAGFYTTFIKNKFPVDEEAKAQLVAGTPSPALWPDEYIESMHLNP